MDSIKPKKFLGQHFLTDLSVAQRIANTVDAYPDIPILEVGPGMGVLTQYIIPKGRPFKVVEIDFDSVPYLHEHFPLLGDNIIEGDFLQMDLQTVFDGKPFVLTGNYPYNISSQIFFKMVENRHLQDLICDIKVPTWQQDLRCVECAHSSVVRCGISLHRTRERVQSPTQSEERRHSPHPQQQTDLGV